MWEFLFRLSSIGFYWIFLRSEPAGHIRSDPELRVFTVQERILEFYQKQSSAPHVLSRRLSVTYLLMSFFLFFVFLHFLFICLFICKPVYIFICLLLYSPILWFQLLKHSQVMFVMTGLFQRNPQNLLCSSYFFTCLFPVIFCLLSTDLPTETELDAPGFGPSVVPSSIWTTQCCY